MALERGRIRKHGQARRATGLIGLRAGGSKSARISPLDGEAFFTSAISAWSPRASFSRMARTNPRGGEAALARASISGSGWACLAAAISSRL
jgi:hypothetical protein